MNVQNYNSIKNYHKYLTENAKKEYALAKQARKKGYDPSFNVEIFLAKDTAERVEGLISVIYPEISGKGLAEKIRELEKQYSKNDLRVSIRLAEIIAKNELFVIEDIEKRADIAIRAAVAYLTLGIVTAPLEGIAEIKIKQNFDGSKYLAVYYAGPIRSAGGTASAMSVLVADVVRKLIGLDRYKPTEEEINRYFTEVEDYYTRVSPKQYHPTKEEMDFIIKNVPVEITGEPTEKLEVSNFKDLERVETNRIRGGMCLVLLDGLPLKAEKIIKFIKKYKDSFDVSDWLWLEDFVKLKKKIHSVSKDDSGSSSRYSPSKKYLDKLVGGRPVLAFPGEKGGFRLRYGRSFTNGLAATNLSIGAFHLFEYLAMGTQVALEAPGKASVVTPHDKLHNPIVLLSNGDVVEIKNKEDAKKYLPKLKEVLFLGDILVPFGEFSSNNHVLLPAAYVEEWWLQEIKDVAPELYEKYKEFWKHFPSFEEALEISKKYGIGLYPKYNVFWHDISVSDLKYFVDVIKDAEKKQNGLYVKEDAKFKRILEDLGVYHYVRDGYYVIYEHIWLKDLIFNKYSYEDIASLFERYEGSDVLELLSAVTGVTIRAKAPTYLGMRMGRPEKAKHREMKGKPQILFPVGDEGGRYRNLMESYEKEFVSAAIVKYRCQDCGSYSYYLKCMNCGSLNTKHVKYCGSREIYDDEECNDKLRLFAYDKINVKSLIDKAYEKLGMERLDLVKGVRGVFGSKRAVEVIEKGLLRAKYGVYVNKDGTIRFDATDIPITHFRPKDIGVSVEKLKSLGYEYDIYGNVLERDDQILMLLPQDIIIPENEYVSTADYLIRVSKFIDEMLEKLYGLPPYYNISSKEDLIGVLVVGLAPHTSSGIVGRIIGFGKAKGILAHPYWHAAKRRNCDGDEDSIMLLLDAFINFSREYLPDSRGARTMDAPLVLTTLLDPLEVDDESWNVDAVDAYSKEFYEKTLEYATLDELGDARPRILEDLIKEGKPFDSYYTLPQDELFDAPIVSKYVEVPEMIDKVKEQLELSKKIRAADEHKIAEEILKKHFLKDMRGNLRQFSRQKFRCSSCNEVYRRLPISGKCVYCGNEIILTVHEGAIRKYTDIIRYIIKNYKVSSYTIQTYELMEETIETMFGKRSSQTTLF